MIHPSSTATRTNTTNPPISGQNTGETYTTGPALHKPPPSRAGRRGQACRATCSLGDGNAQATCWRRSCRKTKRS